ncbi:hypothetical protein AMTR_s00002p00074380 [Amborella trichopoda]|uniref:Uncharacterized protein n=1 Tax=Amborella trichopoda TaxID=13333 RepID=W1P1X8_AMBTC|nr:hypothetical protein AMTR_s00002p00074380 [Amborella trichopoda]
MEREKCHKFEESEEPRQVIQCISTNVIQWAQSLSDLKGFLEEFLRNDCHDILFSKMVRILENAAWNTPSKGAFKLNFDGSVRNDTRIVVLGVY